MTWLRAPHFSPTKKNRERYAAEVRQQLLVEAVAVDEPQAAVRGADIVAVTTDSMVPVIEAAWLEPGMHVTNVRGLEVGPEVIERADVIAMLGTTTLKVDSHADESVIDADGLTAYIAGTRAESEIIPKAGRSKLDAASAGTIPDLMAGLWKGRTDNTQITFLNNSGTHGLQFAAAGGLALERAVKAGLGHEMPREWFLQNIRD
jgi:ornithine cyclodeaminase/alanine dehydrogenase-like protein (mu-crystallin family)